jgi:hypothetical protein
MFAPAISETSDNLINAFHHSTSLPARGIHFPMPLTFPCPDAAHNDHADTGTDTIPFCTALVAHKSALQVQPRRSHPQTAKLLIQGNLTGRSEFKPPGRCNEGRHIGLGNGPDASSARAVASPGMENGHLTLRRYSLSAPCSLFFYFT